MQQYTWFTARWSTWMVLAIFSFCVFFYGFTIPVPATNGEIVVIEVKQGMTSDQIARMLYSRGLISSPGMFQLVAKWKGLGSSLQAGEYAIHRGASVTRIVDMMAKGETNYLQLTIPEGYTVNQIAKLIETQHIGSGTKFKELAKQVPSDYDYMNNGMSSSVVYGAEGFLFPDTYKLSKGITEEQLIAMLTRQFDEKFTPEMRAQATAMGLSTREVIILASLVEKEAQVEADRPVIAGVFLNRLKQDMPLQSCATIQYILGYPKEELSVEDTEIASPFNTYLHRGLPPGPIANPGIASIRAVLHPTVTNYLYFVADKQGAHHFSRTYEDHLAEIEKVRN